MTSAPPNLVSDQECLEAYSRSRRAESLRPVIVRYLPLVYSSAHRRTGSDAHAADVARAVFLGRYPVAGTVKQSWSELLRRDIGSLSRRFQLSRRLPGAEAGRVRLHKRLTTPDDPERTRFATPHPVRRRSAR